MVSTQQGSKLNFIANDNHNDVLVIGCIHGDEPQGELLINDYLEHNKNSKLMFIPCLNPDGLKAGQRTNSNGVDINRNFPTNNWELSSKNKFYGGEKPASEIETRFLTDIIEKYNPQIILALHSPYKLVNYDGDAFELALKIAEIIDYPVEASIGYPTPGSLGTWAGIERNIKTITLELDEKADIKDLSKPVFKIFEMLENYK